MKITTVEPSRLCYRDEVSKKTVLYEFELYVWQWHRGVVTPELTKNYRVPNQDETVSIKRQDDGK